MASDVSDLVDALHEALENRGCSAIHVESDVDEVFAVGDPQPKSRLVRIDVDFDGDPTVLEDAASEVGGLRVQQYETEAYPGGDVHVSGDLAVEDPGSPGANPGGSGGKTPPQHPNTRSSVPVSEMEADETSDPHVEPGGTWCIRDENEIPDTYDVEVWPVRSWEPVLDTPAVTALRYVPAPAAEGLEWWSGYAMLAPIDEIPSAGLFGHMKERLREKRITWEGFDVPISYHDEPGWVGWSAAEMPTEVAGVPVYPSEDVDVAVLDHQEAAEITKRLAQACLKVRREVTD